MKSVFNMRLEIGNIREKTEAQRQTGEAERGRKRAERRIAEAERDRLQIERLAARLRAVQLGLGDDK